MLEVLFEEPRLLSCVRIVGPWSVVVCSVVVIRERVLVTMIFLWFIGVGCVVLYVRTVRSEG